MAHPTKIKQHVARAGRLGPACRVPRECRRGHLEGRIYRTPAWPTSLRTWRRPLHNILANEGALLSVCRLASKGACSKQLGQVFSQCSQSQCALLAEAPGRPTKGLLPAPLNACLSRSRQGCPPRRAHARAPLLVAAQRVLPMLRARAAAPCRAWATAAEASPRCERGGVKGHRGTRALKAPPSRLPPQPPPPFGGHVSPLADTFMHPLGQGLYDPAFDTDSCGVGILGELSKIPTRQCVTDGMEMLKRMQVRLRTWSSTLRFFGVRAGAAPLPGEMPDAALRAGASPCRAPLLEPPGGRARPPLRPPAAACLALVSRGTEQANGKATLDPQVSLLPPRAPWCAPPLTRPTYI